MLRFDFTGELGNYLRDNLSPLIFMYLLTPIFLGVLMNLLFVLKENFINYL